jgi:hypothetical protein
VSPAENAFFVFLGLAIIVATLFLRAFLAKVRAPRRPAEPRQRPPIVVKEPTLMRRLLYPLLGGSASLVILSLLFSSRFFPRWGDAQQLLGGLAVGALASVVLYAVMRAVAERPAG